MADKEYFTHRYDLEHGTPTNAEVSKKSKKIILLA